MNPSVGRESEWGGDTFAPALEPKAVLVVGGGPAGLEAARVAAERGHRVTLAEAGPELGGSFRLAGLQPRRSQITELVEWYERELESVLRPAWWAVALESEFPAEGSFVTFDHVEGPVILRRSGGAIRGYRNVCPHRLAKLTSCASGTCPVLTCGYHGWEFDAETGQCPEDDAYRVAVYPVRVENGRVLVQA